MTLMRCKGLWLLFLLSVLPMGCALLTQPASEPTAPPPEIYFSEAELRALVLPQNLPASQPLPQPEPEPKYYRHTITKPGETLIAIARWYTGNGGNWMHLAEVNQGLNPQRIKIGDTILIPEEMLITRKPIPRSALPARKIPTRNIPQKSPPAQRVPAPVAASPAAPAPVPVAEPAPTPAPKTVAAPPMFGPIENSPSPSMPGEETTLPRPLQRLDE